MQAHKEPVVNNDFKRFQRLPKWAQEHIKVQERDILRLRKALDTIVIDDNTPIHWRDDWDSRHPLPKHATVIFKVGGARIAVRIVADTLYVTEQIGHGLVIIPSAGNAVYLKGE